MDEKLEKFIDASTSEISEDRVLRGNNYAHLDGDGKLSAIKSTNAFSAASQNEITNSRMLLQDPYAYLDEDTPNSYSAISNQTHTLKVDKKGRYSIEEIEKHATSLQNLLWKSRHKLWPNKEIHKPIEVLDPIEALKFIGYDCELEKNLGTFNSNGKPIEVAGLIDKSLKKVRISRHYSPNIQRFTAAHELAHAMLHVTSGLHRDKPLDGTTPSQRNGTEFEADKFAAFFLMPRRLVEKTFQQIFLTKKFILDEATAFALGYSEYDSLVNKCKNLIDLSRILAGAERYNGRHFVSLASQYNVSVEAMAIRLEELQLVTL
jgi:Zn-dependent peptidase ImmA (M78 family)